MMDQLIKIRTSNLKNLREQAANIEKQLIRKLQLLKERHAIEGISVDPSVILKIEDIDKTLDELFQIIEDQLL